MYATIMFPKLLTFVNKYGYIASKLVNKAMKFTANKLRECRSNAWLDYRDPTVL